VPRVREIEVELEEFADAVEELEDDIPIGNGSAWEDASTWA